MTLSLSSRLSLPLSSVIIISPDGKLKQVLTPESVYTDDEEIVLLVIQLPLQFRPTNEYINERCSLPSNVIEPSKLDQFVDVKFDGNVC